jgi:hypothetical protein
MNLLGLLVGAVFAELQEALADAFDGLPRDPLRMENTLSEEAEVVAGSCRKNSVPQLA